MIWKIKDREIDLTNRALTMGILNVTADSFSDGGCFFAMEDAVRHAAKMEAEGADILDIGGESTRPGAAPISAAEELRRVIPVIKALKNQTRAILSIDTSKPEVAHEAMAAGASVINDVTGFQNIEMREVAKKTEAGLIAMHMLGNPRNMQDAPRYKNVVAEIRDFFRQTFDALLTSGIAPGFISFDPGIGFGKTVDHNLSILQNLQTLQVENRPLTLGVSRKSFLGKVTGLKTIEERLWPTVALTSLGRERGARIFRVHDVKANMQALRMTEAILES